MQLIYVSTLTGRDEAALDPIHASAVRRNLASGVTGMLLYLNGQFMQVLEGQRDAVLVTYHRIQNDTRHQNSRVLVEEPIAHRHFPDWSMGMRRIDSPDLLRFPQFGGYLDPAFNIEKIQAQPGIALAMLESFGKSAV
jgi:Sensors of blue-light using FAD